ncbi:MAG: hypothetical protein IJ461_06535 [Clostridia bacterium]|nr:hypothetical protein [Clostridia bacterium]
MVKQAQLDPGYIRVVGTVTLEWFKGDRAVETLEDPGLWEQMYFGLGEEV